MGPEQFQRELRSRCFRSTVTVRRDPKWAREHGWHPDCYLCYDVERGSHVPHVFFICSRGGRPIEPCEAMIHMIQKQRIDRSFGGLGTAPGTYRQNVLDRETARAQRDDQAQEDAFNDSYYGRDAEGRAQSGAGNEQKWTMDPTLQINRGLGW